MVGTGSPAGAVYLFWIFFCYKQVAPLGQLRYWLWLCWNQDCAFLSEPLIEADYPDFSENSPFLEKYILGHFA